jgi:hypothetical protein
MSSGVATALEPTVLSFPAWSKVLVWLDPGELFRPERVGLLIETVG